LKIHGVPDHFIDHGTPAELYRDLQLDSAGIAVVAKSFLAKLPSKSKSRLGALAK